MQHRHLAALIGLIACVLTVAPRLSAENDPQVGTWKMRAAQTNGQPSSSNTLIFEPLANGEKRRSFGVNAQGQKTSSSYTAYYDGKDYPVVGNPDVDAVEILRIDDRTSERINKKNGKMISRARRVISPDGKVMTITTTRADAAGKTVTSTTVYDRQ